MKFTLKPFVDLILIRNLSILTICFLFSFTACGSGGGGGSGNEGGYSITADYIITGSGAEFTAFDKNGNIVGTADEPIDDVIGGIKADAAANAIDGCSIQFGKDDSILDIEEEFISFNNSSGSWGKITLLGKITSANSTAGRGTIFLAGGDSISIDSYADIANTSSGNAIMHNGDGSLTINGGTVKADAGVAVYHNNNISSGKIIISGGIVTSKNTNPSSGTINLADIGGTTDTRLEISGGTVSNTSAEPTGNAIYNNSIGAVNIIGGTVTTTAKIGSAICNKNTGEVSISAGTVEAKEADIGKQGYTITDSKGKITISGTALVTSAFHPGATIYCESAASNIEITGGTVRNTSDGHAIVNGSSNGNAGTVTISAGTVESIGAAINSPYAGGVVNVSGGLIRGTINRAISCHASVMLTISGGTVFAWTSTFTPTVIFPSITPTGDGLIIGWKHKYCDGDCTYSKNSSDDLESKPAATKVWDKVNGKSGISYSYESNTGFIAIDEVEVVE